MARMIKTLWARVSKMWLLGELGMGFFYSAPQDFVMLGVFCARFPPREASIILCSVFVPSSRGWIFVCLFVRFHIHIAYSQNTRNQKILRNIRKCALIIQGKCELRHATTWLSTTEAMTELHRGGGGSEAPPRTRCARARGDSR